MLEHEKAHVTDHILQGVSAISPAGAAVGLAQGTEGKGSNWRVQQNDRQKDQGDKRALWYRVTKG